MLFWGTSRRNFQKRKTLLYCTFSRSTQIWCQNWWFLTLKFCHFKGISQNSLTSMRPIVDAGNLKFWENYPKVVLKRNIIWRNCVPKKGWFLAPLIAHCPWLEPQSPQHWPPETLILAPEPPIGLRSLTLGPTALDVGLRAPNQGLGASNLNPKAPNTGPGAQNLC